MKTFINNFDDKYIMYLRKSRKDIENGIFDDEEILKRHESMLFSLADSLGISKSQILVKREVVSGDTIADRPVIQEVLKLLEVNDFKGVLVTEVERLARGDTKDQGTISEAFTFTNTLIITPGKIYDPQNQSDQEYFEFGLFMSRREYKVITKRLQNGRISAAKEGKFTGSKASYGFNRVKLVKSKGYTLEMNPDTGNVVHMIYTMHSIHYKTPAMIRDFLNNKNIPSPSGGLWTAEAVKRILVNPVNAGFIRLNNRVTTKILKEGKIVKKIVTNKGDIKELVFVEGLHSGIVSKDLYFKTLDIIYSRYIPPVSKGELTNPLSGLLKCKICGRSLASHYSKGNEKRVYCKKLHCTNKSNNLFDIEQKVIKMLSYWLEDKEFIKFEDSSDNMIESKKDLLIHLENDLKKQEKKRNNIYNLFEEQIYDYDTFIERNQNVLSIIKKINLDLEKLKDEIDNLEKIKNQKENFIPTLKNVLESYDKCTNAEQKNLILKSVIDKIYYLKTSTGNRYNKAEFELWILPKMLK